jgi:hypothetical protein
MKWFYASFTFLLFLILIIALNFVEQVQLKKWMLLSSILAINFPFYLLVKFSLKANKTKIANKAKPYDYFLFSCYLFFMIYVLAAKPLFDYLIYNILMMLFMVHFIFGYLTLLKNRWLFSEKKG